MKGRTKIISMIGYSYAYHLFVLTRFFSLRHRKDFSSVLLGFAKVSTSSAFCLLLRLSHQVRSSVMHMVCPLFAAKNFRRGVISSSQNAYTLIVQLESEIRNSPTLSGSTHVFSRYLTRNHLHWRGASVGEFAQRTCLIVTFNFRRSSEKH